MELAQHLKSYDVSRLSKTPHQIKGDLILEIFNLAAKQDCNLPKKNFFILLSVYDEENLRYILSTARDKERQGFSIEAYIKYLRKA